MSNANDDEKKSYLVVFFEGTANTLDPATTQIGIFADAVEGFLISRQTQVAPAMNRRRAAEEEQQTNTHNTHHTTLKMAFDGCGVTRGLAGTLFADGLTTQVNQVVSVVKAMKAYAKDAEVRVIAVGLSRGGISCMKLAKQLASVFQTNDNDSSRREEESGFVSESASALTGVSLSMLLFDPVPGNAVWTGFPFTASLSQNLSDCHNLERVLAVYPYEPLPDLAMHAPTLGVYPKTTKVEEDVTLGCHQGALYMTTMVPRNRYETASNLSFRRIYDFLASEQIQMKFYSGVYQPSAEVCLEICRTQLQYPHPSRRITHDKTGNNRTIIRKDGRIGMGCRWLNKHHEQLEKRIVKQEVQEEPPLLVAKRGAKYQLDFDNENRLLCM